MTETPDTPAGTSNLRGTLARREQTTEGASLVAKIQYAKTLAEASLLPAAYKKNPGNVLLAIELGESLSIATMTAIQNIHVIEGKPSASSALIASLVRRAGHRLRVTGDAQKLIAVAEIVRKDDPEFTYRVVWDMNRANAAKVTHKDNWKHYPLAMLKARCITEAARDACPEALLGIQYTPDELGADWAETDRVIVGPDTAPVDGEIINQETGEVPADDDSWREVTE
jgi:hypothetical protein